ncbi:MAG: MASE1 domain-containing protein, partial [Geminicoccales bacterium]
MWHHRPSNSALVRAVGFALAYLAAVVVGIALTREAGTIAVFWPANALLIGLLLRVRRPDYPLTLAACTLASAIANLGYGDPAGVAVARAALNMLEVLCGYHLIMRYADPDFTLADLRNLFVVMVASMAAPAVSATGAALVLGRALDISFPALWWGWWSRDAVGMLLFLPLVVAFDVEPLERLLFGPWDRRLLLATVELAAAFGLLFVGLGLIISGDWYGSPTLFAPILLWTALRFGVFPTAAVAATIGAVAVVAAANGAWPPRFTATATDAVQILSLQLFVLLVALPPLVVAVVIAERARARRQLDDALESMADAFALYDPDGRLVLCNRRYP